MKEWGKISNVGLIAVAIATLLFGASYFSSYSIKSGVFATSTPTYTTDETVATVNLSVPPPFVVTHIATPVPVKAIYMTSWVAGRKDLRENLVKFIDESELNSIVIDIKDYTGKIAYEVDDPKLAEFGSVEKRITDLKEFIAELHSKGIYVIGRISSFQDSFLVKTHPEWAVKDKAGAVWKDRKGVSWLDAGAKPVWDYLVAIGDDAYAQGFDELNFDYIRFPSDGDMIDIAYPYSQGKAKSLVLKEYYAYLDQAFRPKGIPISADLFGMTTSNYDDLGIGQVLEYALAHFDYVAPMVYPSHYPPNFAGYKNPAANPYEIIHFAMKRGVERAIAATTTPSKLRPWLQDFSIGKTDYTPEMVRAQINATYDVGLDSWMIWNAANRYMTPAYFGPEFTTSSSSPKRTS